jgi:hypothetical protein
MDRLLKRNQTNDSTSNEIANHGSSINLKTSHQLLPATLPTKPTLSEGASLSEIPEIPQLTTKHSTFYMKMRESADLLKKTGMQMYLSATPLDIDPAVCDSTTLIKDKEIGKPKKKKERDRSVKK